ncbi:MAG: translation initiation factor IF-2 [Selenomonadaceae bacterium]|nr:translation initiation factor IF-2 [Selenomonadaceae bacterium]
MVKSAFGRRNKPKAETPAEVIETPQAKPQQPQTQSQQQTQTQQQVKPAQPVQQQARPQRQPRPQTPAQPSQPVKQTQPQTQTQQQTQSQTQTQTQQQSQQQVQQPAQTQTQQQNRPAQSSQQNRPQRQSRPQQQAQQPRRDNRTQENRGERRQDYRNQENRGGQDTRQERGERGDRRQDYRNQEGRGSQDTRQERGERSERRQDYRSQENRIEQEPRQERAERGDRQSKNRNERQRDDGNKNRSRGRNQRGPANAKEAAKTQAAQLSDKQRAPRSARKKNRQQPQVVHKAEIARPTHIKVGESIAVKDLASKMSCTAAEVIKKLLMMGSVATINQEIDFDTAALVAGEFGVTVEELPPEVDPTLIPEIEDDEASLKLRPPVVTVMGHVDHGKTSLLDVIRKSSVTATEAGGITQHIGAYQVICNDRKIVFLDTPGHEAFTAMRARGAQVTDIAILVVAADDGVMPQTIEAINHAKAAGVPIIVAINKIDKPGANPMRVKQELMEHGLITSEYGGDTTMVEVSAKKNMGINELLEMILLEADIQEFKANPNREARGVIIEAQLDKGRGPVATVLVQNGTLRIGDSIVAGTTYGKVRAMMNERGDNLKKAGPSVPVEVLGLNDVPEAGDILAALDEKLAKSIAEHRIERKRNDLIKSKKVSLDDLFSRIQEGSLKDLNILIKADVQGSIEALSGSLLALNKNDEVRVNIVHSGVGAVNESDVMLASSSNALILGFNVRPDNNARKAASTENIDIRTYRVIYDAINDVQAAMSGLLAPKFKEVIQGRVEIRKVMKFSKALVAGSYVLEGKISNNSKIRILRDNIEVFDGEIDSLRRFKDEVKEVAAGYECGISILDYRDFKEGDIIEAYKMEEIETSIEDINHE